MDDWWQLYARAPAGNGYTTPAALRRVDEHLQTLGAVMHVPGPDGLPVQEADGTWEVRVYADPGFVRFVLTKHYGLVIAREVRHRDEDEGQPAGARSRRPTAEGEGVGRRTLAPA